MHQDQRGGKTPHITNRSAESTINGERVPYQSPTVLVIPLVADEVLAVGCKLDGGGNGPIGASCTAAACSAAGS